VNDKQLKELDEILKVLMKGNSFKYPLESSEDGYLVTLERKFTDYINRIEGLKLSNDFKVDISKLKEELTSSISKIIRFYLSGKIVDAYTLLYQLLENRKREIEFLVIESEPNQEIFYRARSSEKGINTKEEIFHIPFDKRHLVGTMRYSIAGVPCLYFGNTIYACWLELGKPDLNKLYISKFKNDKHIKVLDFAITFETLKKRPTIEQNFPKQYSLEKIRAFLSLYPLILACSFKKKYENNQFNMEYIIPNMVLQWISNEKEDIDAIRYFSTKMKHKRYDSIGINTVFPPKEGKDYLKGFCPKLEKTFKFTAPVSWSMINTFPIKKIDDGYNRKIQEDDKILHNIEEIIDSHYKMTKFYQIEQNIDKYFEFLLLSDKKRPKKNSSLNDF